MNKNSSGSGCTFVGVLFSILTTVGTVTAQEKPSLPYIPNNADIVVVMRPAKIMNSGDYHSLKRAGGEFFEKTVDRWTNQYFSVSLAELNEIDQIIYATEIFDPTTGADFSKRIDVMIIRTTKDNSEQFELATHDIAETIEFKNKEYFQTNKPVQRRYRFVHIADKKTIICAVTKHAMEAAIDTGSDGPSKSRWHKQWQEIGNKPFSVVVENDAIKTTGIFAYLAQQSSKETDGAQKVEYMMLGAEPGQKSKINCRIFFPDQSAARGAAKFVEQSLEMAWNMLNMQEAMFKKQGQEAIFNMARDALKSTEVKAVEKMVDLSSSINIDFKSLEPLFESNYRAMVRSEAANNLRQVTLSIHNYESANGKMPPPVLVSDSGKKYSWRIAVLPYIGEKELYDQYRFDEEWNSPHNLKVTSKMPDAFRSNTDDKETTNTSWFLLSGEEGIYGGEKGGTFASIRDGTSNTILAVEADRAVHWAEPVDIEIDPKTGIPKLGGIHKGGFNASFADGSVRFISENTDPQVLWQLYTASGGEVVDHNGLNRDDD